MFLVHRHEGFPYDIVKVVPEGVTGFMIGPGWAGMGWDGPEARSWSSDTLPRCPEMLRDVPRFAPRDPKTPPDRPEIPPSVPTRT